MALQEQREINAYLREQEVFASRQGVHISRRFTADFASTGENRQVLMAAIE
jgi:hypothetical protein